MKHSRASIAAVALLLAACNPAGPGEGLSPSFLRAEISGSSVTRYQGTGEFWQGGAPGIGRPATFGINSRGDASASGASLSFWWQGRGRPEAGSYTLRLPEYSTDRWDQFAAAYHHSADGWMEAFVAESGSVRITASTAKRIEGTFRFSAVRYCARPLQGTPQQIGSCRPDEVDANAPRIEVTGSFAAAPSDHEVMARPGGGR